MHQLLNNDEDLIKQLVPDFPIGCRRITPNNGYLQAIQAPNAYFSMDPILRITETGIETTKGEQTFDLIVCATGFDTSFRPYWPVTGKNGISLSEKWKRNPQAYLGICAPDMPNYFMFVGPNSPYAHGDSLATMEWTAQYILKWCKKIACEDIRYAMSVTHLHPQFIDIVCSAVKVKKDVVDDFNIYSHEFLKRTVWAGNCRMWWKDGSAAPDGNITAMYAGSVLHFKGMLLSHTCPTEYPQNTQLETKSMIRTLLDRQISLSHTLRNIWKSDFVAFRRLLFSKESLCH